MTDENDQQKPTIIVPGDESSDPDDGGPLQWTDHPPIPDVLPVLPLRNTVALPGVITPFVISRDKSMTMINEASIGNRMVALVAQKNNDTEDPDPDDLYRVGSAALIVRMLRFPDDTIRVLAQVIHRIRIIDFESVDPFMKVRVEPLDDVVEEGKELEALRHNLGASFQKMVDLHEHIPEEAKVVGMNIESPGRFADFVASSLSLEVPRKQELLEELDVAKRLRAVGQLLEHEVEILELSSKIKSDTTSRMEKTQRDYFLRQQLESIRKELGEGEGGEEVDKLRKDVEEADLPEHALEAAERELDRLASMHPSSAEYSVARTYIDWMVTLPWKKSSDDQLDLEHARQVLDEDHYGLDKPKQRILEYLSVRKLKQDLKGPILCFVGPPGVGKTSLGKSIARTMVRELVRISLGGVRDEAEIRGHRRTYVGALPGRIIQGLRTAGTNNPVFMLDEVDKLGNDFRGDPSSALLEVLDPEQNNAFSDHYLEVHFDLSKVMFITTANVLPSIPGPLRDRMEVLEFSGYTDREKLGITRQHLLPKQLAEHGLTPKNLTLTDRAILRIINQYTREAGVRNVEREIATLCRKVAHKVALGEVKKKKIDSKDVPEYLGKQKHFPEVSNRRAAPGVVTGLAWTPYGGEILFVESSAMPGKKGFTLTGHLGDVMKESAHAALSFIRAHHDELDVKPEYFEEHDIHVHVPSGAIPKDGPSAGVAMVASIASLLADKTVNPKTAMTGEITLSGKVLPVGGVKEKVLAAHRAGIKRVVIPERNVKDLDDVPEKVRQDLTFHAVNNIEDALDILLRGKKTCVVENDDIAEKPGTTTTKKSGRKKTSKKKKKKSGTSSSKKKKSRRKTSSKKKSRRKKSSGT